MRKLALLLSLAGFFVLAARCGGDDSSTPTDAGVDAYDLCDLDAFLQEPKLYDATATTGLPCPGVSNRVCFAECEAGGCKCVASASGPVWKCTEDFSCLPDGSPLDDTGAPDAGAVDSASGDDASDAQSVDASND